MNEEIITAAKEIVKKINDLPKDSEFVIGNYFKDYNFDTKEKFQLMEEILKLCENNKIDIINLQAGMELGMPWVFKYKKNN